MRHKGRYAAIGFFVSKVVLPIVKRQAKKTARAKARGAITGTKDVARRNPARVSIAVGAVLGAAGWLITRSRDGGGDDDA